MIEKLLGPVMGILTQQLKFKGDRQELRRVIRQRIIAPNADRLHYPTVRKEVARDIITAAYATKTMSMAQSVVFIIMQATIFPMKIRLVDSILKTQANAIKNSVVIEEDHDEFTFKVKKGKSALKRLVRDIIAIL